MVRNWMQTAVLSLIFAAFLTAFALSNSQNTKVSLVFWQGEMSLALVILVSILTGVICTGIVAVIEETKMLRHIKKLEEKVKEQEGQSTL
ncbi:lipopolysaccharide assembly LapA domain-containing protein [Candidatus Margulisiibacteriota bacterium]